VLAAIPHYEQSLRADPRYASSYYNYAEALQAMGRAEEAAAARKSAARWG
jgi:tetratricopeptide (TPR) repeat protein